MTEDVTNDAAENAETTAESTEATAETETGNVDKITALYEDKPKEEDAPKEGEESKVTYTDFELPDDYKLSDDDVTRYHERGKKFNMSQEDLQADINDRMDIQKSAVEAHQKVISEEDRAEKKGWKEALEKDPDLGGKNMNQSLINVDKVAHKYGGKEGFDALIESGMAINPHLVRMFNKIAKLTEDDSFVQSEGAGTKELSIVDKFNSAYKDSNPNVK